MYIGRENRSTASLMTFTIPACEHLSIAMSLGSTMLVQVTQRAKYHKPLPQHVYGGVSLIHNILNHS